MKRRDALRLALDLVSTAAMTVASVAICYVIYQQQRVTSGGVAETVSNITLEAPSDATLKKGTPKYALVEFGDYQCPYCGQSAKTLYPSLKKEFVDAGTIAYVFRNFPLEGIHAFAQKASEAAICAGQQGKFWDMHDTLYSNQQALADNDLLEYAQGIGIDMDRFRDCMTHSARRVIDSDKAEGRRAGVNSTPTFFIGEIQGDGRVKALKRIAGAIAYEQLKAQLSEVIPAKVAMNNTPRLTVCREGEGVCE